jgi:hypothetical protein
MIPEAVNHLRDKERNRWAVSLRMKGEVFGWCIMRAGEAGIPVTTFINKRLEDLATADLQRGGPEGDR